MVPLACYHGTLPLYGRFSIIGAVVGIVVEYLFMLLLTVLNLRITDGDVYHQYSSHAPTHGTAWLLDLSVYHEVACILYERLVSSSTS